MTNKPTNLTPAQWEALRQCDQFGYIATDASDRIRVATKQALYNHGLIDFQRSGDYLLTFKVTDIGRALLENEDGEK